MKSKLIKTLQILIFLALGIFLLYLAFKGVNIGDVWEALKKAKYEWIILSLFFHVIAFLARTARWKVLIEPLGYNPRFSRTFYAIALGYTANFALPRIGEITRCGTLAKTEKIPVDALIGTVIAERLIDLLVSAILLITVFLYQMDTFGKFISQNILHPFAIWVKNLFTLSLSAWIVFISAGVVLITLYIVFRRKILNISILRKFNNIGKGILKGIRSVWSMKRKKVFILHTLIIWIMYYLMTYVVCFSFDFTSHLTPMDGLYILIVGTVGMIIPVQGGIGSFHAIVTLGLSIYGITKEKALIFATMSHESQSLLILFMGLFAFIMLYSYSGKKNKHAL